MRRYARVVEEFNGSAKSYDVEFWDWEACAWRIHIKCIRDKREAISSAKRFMKIKSADPYRKVVWS